MTRPPLVSGIQPSGRLHVGNYLGALRQFVEFQDSEAYRCYFFIADLHSLTEDFDAKEKQNQILTLAADFLAAGLDPDRSILFQQSQIPEHTEAAWILGTLTPFGELERMTQFKEKGAAQKNVNVGLFTYPVLMAVDILLYEPAVVPVGDDQLQHLELTRTLARKFNKRFGKTFIEPKALLTEAPRIMSLDDPEKKMSKSNPKGCLFLDDEPGEIRKKIKRAITDSEGTITHNPKKRPAVSNLIQIYASLSRKTPKDVEREFEGKGYAEFKEALADLFEHSFENFREKRMELLRDREAIVRTLEEGSKQAALVAREKTEDMKRKVGIAL